MEDDRYNPLAMDEQEAVIDIAVRAALKSEKSPIPGSPEFTKALAEALQQELSRRCVDHRLYA